MSGADGRYATLARAAGIDPDHDITEHARDELRALAEHVDGRHEAVVELLGAIRALAGARIAVRGWQPESPDNRPAAGHGTRVPGPPAS